MKEKVLIRYLGLGWSEAHHPWSKNNYIFTPSELLKHFVEVVIPLQQIKQVPDHPPFDLPTQPEGMVQLGTKAANLVALDKANVDKEMEACANTMIEREERESQGFGDQLSDVQCTSCPIERIRAGGFMIDMLFVYGEDELSWCQGTVTKVVKEKGNLLKLEIEWNKECVREGEVGTTVEILRLANWNSETHTLGTWREDAWGLMETSFQYLLIFVYYLT